jgi:hypothetical protein
VAFQPVLKHQVCLLVALLGYLQAALQALRLFHQAVLQGLPVVVAPVLLPVALRAPHLQAVLQDPLLLPAQQGFLQVVLPVLLLVVLLDLLDLRLPEVVVLAGRARLHLEMFQEVLQGRHCPPVPLQVALLAVQDHPLPVPQALHQLLPLVHSPVVEAQAPQVLPAGPLVLLLAALPPYQALLLLVVHRALHQVHQVLLASLPVEAQEGLDLRVRLHPVAVRYPFQVAALQEGRQDLHQALLPAARLQHLLRQELRVHRPQVVLRDPLRLGLHPLRDPAARPILLMDTLNGLT